MQLFLDFGAFFDNSSRVADRDGFIGNAMCYDRTCSDHRSLTNPDTIKYYNTDSQPCIVINNDATFGMQWLAMNWLARLEAVIVWVE